MRCNIGRRRLHSGPNWSRMCFRLLTLGFELWTLIFGLRSLTKCIRHGITDSKPKTGKFKWKLVKFKHYSIVFINAKIINYKVRSPRSKVWRIFFSLVWTSVHCPISASVVVPSVGGNVNQCQKNVQKRSDKYQVT